MSQKIKEERNRRIVVLYETGKTMRDIARELDITFQRVQQILDQYGIKARPMGIQYVNVKYDHDEICTKAKAGVTPQELAIEYSTSTSYIQSILTLNDIPYIRRKVQPRRWTAEYVAELYARHMRGETVVQIAAEQGVKPSNISRVFARYGYRGRLGRPVSH